MARTRTVTVSTSRRSGDFTSPEFDATGATAILIQPSINTTDRLNSGLSIQFELWVAQDGVNFELAGFAIWKGGIATPQKPGSPAPPYTLTTFEGPLPAGTKARTVLRTPVSIRCGVIAEVERP